MVGGKKQNHTNCHWFNWKCLSSLVLMIKLLFFRNRWLVCLKLCNGKSWWVPSCSLWFVKCSVNTVERAVDPLISLYIHRVYGVCLAWYIFMSLSRLQPYIFSTSGPDQPSISLFKFGFSGFSLVALGQCLCVAEDFTCECYFMSYVVNCECWKYELCINLVPQY